MGEGFNFVKTSGFKYFCMDTYIPWCTCTCAIPFGVLFTLWWNVYNVSAQILQLFLFGFVHHMQSACNKELILMLNLKSTKTPHPRLETSCIYSNVAKGIWLYVFFLIGTPECDLLFGGNCVFQTHSLIFIIFPGHPPSKIIEQKIHSAMVYKLGKAHNLKLYPSLICCCHQQKLCSICTRKAPCQAPCLPTHVRIRVCFPATWRYT
jgi:hypothetical protein